MKNQKPPGVYIQEIDALGNSVPQVPTAIPAFIGYTQKAIYDGEQLLNKPVKISSLGEYTQLFGGAPGYEHTLIKTREGETADAAVMDGDYALQLDGPGFNLFNALRLFYANGGAECYIVSVGDYTEPSINVHQLRGGITPLLKESEPTMIVIPEAVRLSFEDCASLQQAILTHCAEVKSRVGVLDIHDGYKGIDHEDGDVIAAFRNNIGVDGLSYGAAYYPWLHTGIVGSSELGLENFNTESLETLKDLVMAELSVPKTANAGELARIGELRTLFADIPSIREANYKGPTVEMLNKTLMTVSPAFKSILSQMQTELNLLPPAAAIAGIYTLVDNARGVWKAPANVSLSSVIKPSVEISHAEQEDLNVPTYGKAVNAIRSFVGQGVLVWGARTLDGNSEDWRYVNVRRTIIMIEQSIQMAAKAYVFEPNDEGTWINVRSMIDNFLNGLWQQGGLAGATPGDAYTVSVGLGSTMTPADILDGIMRISVKVAIIRPAEFIVITFQQEMQKV